MKHATKFTYLWQASPNELGDTLAGLAGTLAFIWIIVTVCLQSIELRAQREELRLTRSESAKMAKALDAQVNILVAEQKDREAKLAIEENEKLIEHCRAYCANQSFFEWVSESGPKLSSFLPPGVTTAGNRIMRAEPSIHFKALGELLEDLRTSGVEYVTPPRFGHFVEWIETIADNFKKLPLSEQEKLLSMNFSHIDGQLRLLDLIQPNATGSRDTPE